MYQVNIFCVAKLTQCYMSSISQQSWKKAISNKMSTGIHGASQVTLVAKNLPVNAADQRDVGLILGIPFQSQFNWCMATHSSSLAWKIPGMEEPGGLQSMGSQWVGHEWATSLSLFTFMHWRRKWQPTPVFFPEESQGRGSLVGCRLWGRTESDTTEVT